MPDSGSKRVVRLRDIAREAGVSTATVSYALTGAKGVSGLTRRRILSIADQMGYVPNRQAASLRSRRSYTLGVMVTNIKNPFFADMVCAIEKSAAARYRIMLCVTEDGFEQEAHHLKMLLEHNVDGLILVPVSSDSEGTYPNLALLKMFQRRRVPIICIVDGVRDLKTGRILTDVYAGTRMLIDHLAELGHQDIAYFSQPFSRVQKFGRHAAYYDALRMHGLPARPELLVETGLTPEEAYDRTTALVDSGVRFTAAVYPNDYMAIGGIRALLDRGLRVPQDISVTGFDDIEWARFCEVPLTTARFPRQEIGERAVREMIEHLASEPLDTLAGLSDVTIPPELVIRQSTGPAPVREAFQDAVR